MNRNVESHFSELPSVDIRRSIFDRSHSHKTSFNVGELIPFYIDEVLPGDTFNVTTSKVVRLQTLLTPVMDNLYLDTYFFFGRGRDLWTHFKEFAGENTESAWIPETTYQIPSISSPEGGFDVGTIADYLGLPVKVEWDNDAARRPSALPFRFYAKICDEWFRDENLTDPLNIPLGDSNQTGSNGTDYINDIANGGKPFLVAKYHDYFTSALPSPQKGPDVTFPLLSSGFAPVGARSVFVDHPNLNNDWFRFGRLDGSNVPSGPLDLYLVGAESAAKGVGYYPGNPTGDFGDGVVPSNLWAALDTTVGAVSINELRLAFDLQRFYEKNARGGTRYTELLRSHFGVTAPDAVLQRVEYLGGNRIQINIHEVENQAQGEQDFLGDLGAMSVTSDIHEDFVHSFTEHGYVMGVCCLRYDHSYPQGLERFWSRRNFTDFYLPVFAEIGEQPVYDSEIYADAISMASDTVFGYQEAWADYRYKPDRVSGEMRPGVSNTLASWHFADYYTEKPILSDSWIREDKTNVDRTLAVTSANANQAFMDVYIKNICTRPMPIYSIPGLADHH